MWTVVESRLSSPWRCEARIRSNSGNEEITLIMPKLNWVIASVPGLAPTPPPLTYVDQEIIPSLLMTIPANAQPWEITMQHHIDAQGSTMVALNPRLYVECVFSVRRIQELYRCVDRYHDPTVLVEENN